MLEEVSNHSGGIIFTMASAYVTLMFFLMTILFKKLNSKTLDKMIDDKIKAKTDPMQVQLKAISENIGKIMEAIFKDIHLVNNRKD